MLAPKEIDALDKPAVSEMVNSIKELYDRGKCKTDEEVEQRIDSFFTYCADHSFRPGIESLCTALHITRTTLFNWSHGIGCSERRQQAAEMAKSFVNSFLEQAVLSGRINPASGIFLLKNWASYKDAYSIEELSRPASSDIRASQSPEEIARHIIEDIPIDE